MRSFKTLALALALTTPASAFAATLHKTPGCGCCEDHAKHLRQNGIAVESVESPDLDRLREAHGVPTDMVGCHMLEIDGYVVEGHVSARTIKRLLAERPAVKGISMPGMPTGSAGMGGPKTEPFVIQSFGGAGGPAVYEVE